MTSTGCRESLYVLTWNSTAVLQFDGTVRCSMMNWRPLRNATLVYFCAGLCCGTAPYYIDCCTVYIYCFNARTCNSTGESIANIRSTAEISWNVFFFLLSFIFCSFLLLFLLRISNFDFFLFCCCCCCYPFRLSRERKRARSNSAALNFTGNFHLSFHFFFKIPPPLLFLTNKATTTK